MPLEKPPEQPQDALKAKMAELFSEGPEKVHVLADFDGTLTEEFAGGKKPLLLSRFFAIMKAI